MYKKVTFINIIMITGTPFIFIILKCFTTQGQTITGGKKAVLFFEKKPVGSCLFKFWKNTLCMYYYLLPKTKVNRAQKIVWVREAKIAYCNTHSFKLTKEYVF